MSEVLSVAVRLRLWIGTALLLYRYVPATGSRFADALSGALVAALLFLGISLASEVVFARATEWSVVYGSLTTVLVFLYSVYLYASALLLGAAFAAEWSRPRPPSDVPLRGRIRSGIRGLFVRRSP